jgi:AraC family transcriptional regulator, transcriptional activator of pobA
LIFQFNDKVQKGTLILWDRDKSFSGNHPYQPPLEKFYAIVYNRGDAQQVWIDNTQYLLPQGSILPLMFHQHYRFTQPDALVIWQFNREFYCVVNHDKEVGCAGFLFYGLQGVIVLQPGEAERRKLDLLLEVFKDEFDTRDDIQGNMLRMLLVRLIISITRIARVQTLPVGVAETPEFDIIRQYHILVEQHYKQEHEVQFYAARLFKSPKTLSNVFKKIHAQSPLQVIHQRLLMEARRLLTYSEKPAKQIADELGFEDAAHFSKFFKKMAGISPSDLRNQLKNNEIGKN